MPARLTRALVLAIAITSAATPAMAHDPILAAAGDIACAPGQVSTPTECQQAATARLIERARLAAVAALGDNQYEEGRLRSIWARALSTPPGAPSSR